LAEDALKGITKLVQDCIEDMQASGEDVPEPFSMREYSGRFQVRMTPEVHRRLAIQAAEQGVSLNRIAAAKLAL
jgi:predicted HicB family RNase H-like nuclease